MVRLIYSLCAALFVFVAVRSVGEIRSGRAVTETSVAFLMIAIVLQELASKSDGRALPFISAFRWTCFVCAVISLVASGYRS